VTTEESTGTENGNNRLEGNVLETH